MNTITKTILKGVAAGLLASWIKSIAEPPLQKIGEDYFPPEPGQLELKGADVTHRPENMPPAVLAKSVYKQFTHQELSGEQTQQAMTGIHYTLGAVIGVAYLLALRKKGRIIPAQGLVAGTVIWAATHGSLVPALGLQDKVSEMPASWWVWEFGSHLVFGVALEQSRIVLNKVF